MTSASSSINIEQVAKIDESVERVRETAEGQAEHEVMLEGVEDERTKGTEGASPVDKLPDELLFLILSIVYNETDISWPHHRRTLLVDKRFKRLTDEAAVKWSLSEDTLPFLFLRPHLHRSLRQASYSVYHGGGIVAFKYMSLVLPVFSALTSLAITGALSSDDNPDPIMPAVFTDALKTLPHLKSLSIFVPEPWELEDDFFSIGELSSLEELDLGECRCVDQLLTTVPPSFTRMRLTPLVPEDNGLARIPWSALSSLSIMLGSTSHGSIRSPAQDLVASLLSALYTRPSQKSPQLLPLRTFRLEDEIYCKRHIDSLASPEDILDLLRALSHTTVEKLELRFASSFELPAGSPPLPTVTELSVRGYANAAGTAASLQLFPELLAKFPSLTTLHLHDLQFSIPLPNAEPADTLQTLSLTEPILATLLDFVRASKVLRFWWRPRSGGGACLWKRSTSEEEFEFERFVVQV